MKNSIMISSNDLFSRSVKSFESGRYGYMAVMLLIHCCIGSIAGSFALYSDIPILFELSVTLCIGANAALIALSPAKWCVGLFYLSVIGNLSILLLTQLL